MSKSTTSSVFLDVNVWLALSTRDHQHFEAAWKWYMSTPQETVLTFCRFTQLGYLRLLTTQGVMGKGTLSQAEAWQAYDQWIEAAGAELIGEPLGVEPGFRSRSSAEQASPKEWADAYLAAFAEAAGLTLVTFDRALAAKVEGAELLG
ncbi:MAG: TA system VapC family ribonuclease toxin [Terracidiphilus sp.]